MHDIKWSSPIEVGFVPGGAQTVNGPTEALHCLANMWPDRRGPQYVAARSGCRAAVAGRKTVEEARALFISAAQEAHLKLQ